LTAVKKVSMIYCNVRANLNRIYIAMWELVFNI
jgi:hypothetical protein